MKPSRMVLLALAGLFVASAALAAEPPPKLLGAFGSQGSALGQMNRPTGIAFDMEGQIVVADSRNGRIGVFQTDGTPVELLRRAGTGDIPMVEPSSVGTCHSGRIYVSDPGGNCVWVLDRGGILLDDWGGGNGPGQFNQPAALDVMADGSVFVTVRGGQRIMRMNGTGSCICEWRPAGTGPFSVTCDHLGHVFVADHGSNEISKYSCSGAWLEGWGQTGSGIGEFRSPHDIACDNLGNVYVVDTGNHRIQKFDNHGRFLTQWGVAGEGDGQFVEPVAIAVSHDGAIAVADAATHRIQVFGRPPEVKAFMDVIPGSCANVLESGGSMQVALVGTETFDAMRVDPLTVRFASLSPALYGIGDVSGPPANRLDPCACPAAGGDGLDDLVFTFDAGAVHSAIGGAGPHTVVMTGALRDGTPFTARGCLEAGAFAQPVTARDRIVVRFPAAAAGDYDIGFTLAANGRVRLSVIDVSGRIVSRVLDDWRSQGEHRIAWNPGALKSGVYFLRLEAGDQVIVTRFPLTR